MQIQFCFFLLFSSGFYIFTNGQEAICKTPFQWLYNHETDSLMYCNSSAEKSSCPDDSTCQVLWLGFEVCRCDIALFNDAPAIPREQANGDENIQEKSQHDTKTGAIVATHPNGRSVRVFVPLDETVENGPENQGFTTAALKILDKNPEILQELKESVSNSNSENRTEEIENVDDSDTENSTETTTQPSQQPSSSTETGQNSNGTQSSPSSSVSTTVVSTTENTSGIFRDFGPRVIVFREGRAEEVGRGQFSLPATITLIIDNDRNMIVDTGIPTDKNLKQILLSKLRDNKLRPDDIHYVITTHGHPDHFGQANLFPSALQYFGAFTYFGNTFTFTDLYAAESIPLTPNVKIYRSPGHTPQDVSILVRNVAGKGTVGIVGDLFMAEEDITYPDMWEPLAWDVDIQRANRRMILCETDYIIPGHGIEFKVTKKLRELFTCDGRKQTITDGN